MPSSNLGTVGLARVTITAVEVTLPVARLLAARLIENPEQTHVAEILVGGLLRPGRWAAPSWQPRQPS